MYYLWCSSNDFYKNKNKEKEKKLYYDIKIAKNLRNFIKDKFTILSQINCTGINKNMSI